MRTPRKRYPPTKQRGVDPSRAARCLIAPRFARAGRKARERRRRRTDGTANPHRCKSTPRGSGRTVARQGVDAQPNAGTNRRGLTPLRPLIHSSGTLRAPLSARGPREAASPWFERRGASFVITRERSSLERPRTRGTITGDYRIRRSPRASGGAHCVHTARRSPFIRRGPHRCRNRPATAATPPAGRHGTLIPPPVQGRP